ncbi:cell surface protein [Rhizobium sp. RMa-01]|uniref:cell surface protein n=1 Tax=unclassified Rhizobium TaxID=2613769 RepID=UPI0008D95CD3|nr:MULTISPECIES: cell surface protein [unclassified Rhizobium]OHV18579.1 cell surface protein [Rhizobium sp. RSm-3]RVU09317.1 cell surface protein [Rhizobium sp. RMa-01]
MRQKTAARLPLTILGVFAFLANIDVATAAPLHPTAPPIAAASDLAQQVAQAKVPALNGYRGYENRRPGYIKSANGYWYPARAFSNPSDYTGSIGRQQRLNDACDYGFTPTNGSSRCNY